MHGHSNMNRMGWWVAPVAVLALATTISAAERNYQRTVENVAVPGVTLVDQNGRRVLLTTYLESEQPVLVDFIFSSCSTICPVLSAGFVNLQGKLGEESRKVRMVSISIDPENDRPKVMREYLKRYRAKPGWDFLTGSRIDIDAVMRAFNAYVPDKMSHYPLMFIRSPKDGTWIRTFGIMSTAELINEVRSTGGL